MLDDIFLMLQPNLKKAVHLDLCDQALRVWKDYCDHDGTLDYVETVCGTKQVVDATLPAAAMQAVRIGKDSGNVAFRYQEPIAAMQDDDLQFPDDIEFAYYSIYNLFRRYIGSTMEDDWLIVNQALSAQGKDSDYASILAASIDQASEQNAGGNGSWQSVR